MYNPLVFCFLPPFLQLKEDHQKALLRREFELQSLNLQRRLEQKFWSQEKNLLVQESQQFKQNFLLLFMKLKWFLKHWRQGKILPNEGNDFLEVVQAFPSELFPLNIPLTLKQRIMTFALGMFLCYASVDNFA